MRWCGTDAAGKQAGPRRQPKKKSDGGAGADISRGEARLNIQTTLCTDLPAVPLERSVFMQQHQALFYECSARTGCNMEELMTELARCDVFVLCLFGVATQIIWIFVKCCCVARLLVSCHVRMMLTYRSDRTDVSSTSQLLLVDLLRLTINHIFRL